MFDTDDYDSDSDSDSDSVMNDVSDSGSGRKRRKPSIPNQLSLSFVKPSQSTKQKLLMRDSFQCWLCEVNQPDILEASHNISAASQAVFQRYKSQGLFPASLTHPAHADNLILLCKNCHGLYDAPSPGWVVLPEDLEFFINWEEQDYKRRGEQAALEGIVVPRTVPTTSDYAGGFVPYLFDSTAKWMMRPANTTVFPKKYLGAPTAIILKAALTVFQPFPEDQQLGIGIQDSVTFKLYTLLSLYKRGKPSSPSAEPGVPGTLATIVDEEEIAPGSGPVATTVQGIMPTGTTDWPSGEGSRNTNRPEQRYHSSPSARGPIVERPQDALPRLDLSPSRSTLGGIGDEVWDPRHSPSEPFAFGPESTSASAMSWVAGIRGFGGGKE
ncbi:MAG: hypothetical protein M1839_001734 [Geoglossum umbratile]|nr:MAG: hypothetical protein M1839_001734 [Geoglossum umbratile]